MQSTTTPHLGDGELLHLVDRDASAWELDVWSKHVLACEQCAARLAERRRTAAAVGAALGVIRLPAGFPTASETMRGARTRRRPRATVLGQLASRPALRAAAAIAVLLLPVLLVSPLRAAVVEWLRQGWSQLPGTSGDEGTAPAAPADAPGAAPTYAVSFTPAGDQVAITLAERQSAGRITIGATSGAEASLEVLGGGDETPLVSDAGLRIVNTTASTAAYEIAIPAGVRAVVVRIGDEPAVTLGAAELAAGWSREFGAPAP